MLLIGDKVINASPPQHEYWFQLDLGEQWKQLTGLPFVFAMWMIRRDYPPVRAADLAAVLADARRRGGAMTEALLDRYAATKQWPRDLAREYFTEYLKYTVTDASRAGVATFFELCGKHRLLSVRRTPEYLGSEYSL
jgi:chorismate dehydratase